MKKSTNRIAAFLICGICMCTSLSGFTACSKTAGVATVNVWTASGTEKIMRAVDYSSRYNDKLLEFNVFRNEYESAQIIISSDKKIDYDIEVADLTDGKGDVLSSDSFEIYHEKYIKVETVRNVECTLGAGDYPDAILPYEKAVEYKENYVPAGQNQGIWVMVNPSKTQQAGVYTGDFTVKAGDKSYSVPVSVTVYDYTLSDEVHQKTSFGVYDSYIQVYELDCTKETLDAYREFYFSHRISGIVPYTQKMYSNNLDMYFDYVIEYTKDPRCTKIDMPVEYHFDQTYIEVDSDGKIAMGEDRGKDGNSFITTLAYNYVKMQDLLCEFMSRSLENNMDLFRKAAIVATILDEFDSANGNAGRNRVLYNLRRFDDLINSVAEIIENLVYEDDAVLVTKELAYDEMNNDAGVGYVVSDRKEPYEIPCKTTYEEFETLQKAMAQSCREIRMIVTTTFYSIFEEYKQTAKSDYCPRITAYNTAEARTAIKDYAEVAQSDIWTYTCGNPYNPYPTYHIDDYLLSSRLMSWMMYDYDITGVLYWATELGRYTSRLTETSQLVDQDYYQNSLRDNSANGDGFLTYPGRQYGIKGPVGTIRLESIRDGIEDYDLMYALENMYRQRGVEEKEFDEVFALISKDLYTGTVCSYGEDYLDNFDSARQKLAQLLVLASSDGVVFEKYEEVADKGTFVISAKTNTSVKYNGNLLSGEKNGDLVTYTATVDLSKGAEIANFEFVTDGAVRIISFGTPKATVHGQDDIASHTSVKSTGTLTDGGKEYKKYDLVKNADNEYVQIDVKVESYHFDKNCNKLVLKYYYDGDENTNVMLKVRAKDAAYATVRTVAVENGWNEIVLDIADSGVSKSGVLEYVRLRFDNADESKPVGKVMLAFDYIVIYGEKS